MPETLRALEKHREDFTVFSNLDHGFTGGHQGVPVLLSGVRPVLAHNYPEGNISLDQKLAEHHGAATRFPSMTLGCREANLLSFTRTGVQVPPADLRAAYRAMFLEDPADKRAAQAERYQRHESIVEKLHPGDFTPRPDKKIDKEAHESWPLDMAKVLFRKGYPGPHLRIHSLRVEPLIEAWPPRSNTALYGSGSGEEREVRQLLSRFAERAFRRPVSEAEIEPYVQLMLREKPELVVDVAGGINGLRYGVYEGRWSKLPDFDKLEPVAKGELPKGYIDIGVSGRKDYYAVVFEGKLEAPKAGDYTFEMASDDGARILVDGKKVVEHDGLHGPELRKGTVRLDPGAHEIRVDYVAYGLPNSFRAGWSGQGSQFAKLSVDSLHNMAGDSNKSKDK